MKNVFKNALCLSAALLLSGALLASSLGGASAQVPGLPPGPYNVPVTNPASNTPAVTPVLTNTAQGAATVSSNIIQNLAYAGVICTFNQSAHTGSPSITFGIDYYDEASAKFQQLVISGAISADATPTSVVVYPGAALTTTPTGMVLEALKLPRYFRVREVVAGTATPTTTGTIGCDLLR